MQNLQLNSDTAIPTGLLSPAVHFFDRSANSHKRQVHLGRLHMRPIQWHLRNNWKVPESLEKVIPAPRSLHPHLQWWLEESNVLQGQPLHNKTCSANIYRCIKEECGSLLGKHTARGTWSLPENKVHINYLELKAVFLALMEFQGLCSNKIVFVATGNTAVVSYINKEGDMRSGPPCALLWSVLTWCTRKQVTKKKKKLAERGSRQAIPARPDHANGVVSLFRGLQINIQQVALAQDRFICYEVRQQVASVSPVPDPLAATVDALGLSWEDLDTYVVPPSAMLGKWRS